MKYVFIQKDGTRIIKDNVAKISDHISCEEWNTGNAEKVLVFEPLILLFETVRGAIGKPIVINSGYRSLEHQQRLYEEDLASNHGKPTGKVAKPVPGQFPHGTGAAMDIAIPVGFTAEKLQSLFQNTSMAIGLKSCRVGRKKYKDRFLHVDLTYLLYEPYTDISNPLPSLWKPGVTW